MKKLKFEYSGGTTCLAVSVHLLRKDVFCKYTKSFQKLYPQATDVEWEQMAGCCGREFVQMVEVDVWFNKQAEWVMTETDVESLEKVPAPQKHS